jgi:hypothetical protein
MLGRNIEGSAVGHFHEFSTVHNTHAVAQKANHGKVVGDKELGEP